MNIFKKWIKAEIAAEVKKQLAVLELKKTKRNKPPPTPIPSGGESRHNY